VTVRGYRMTEVDWLLDQFAQVLDERDAEIAQLRAGATPAAGAHAAPVERDDVEDTDPAGIPVPADEEERGRA
jgi:hypothetical protein